MKLEINSPKNNESIGNREENGVWGIYQEDPLQGVISIKTEEKNAQAMGAEREWGTISWTSKFYHPVLCELKQVT